MRKKKLTSSFMRGFRSVAELQPAGYRVVIRDSVVEAAANSVDLAEKEVADLIKEAYAEVTAGQAKLPSISSRLQPGERRVSH